MVGAKHPGLAELLKGKIREGEYERCLPGINALAAEFNVNNRTMIKVVRTLENDGYVKRISSKGTFITRLKRQRTHILGVVLGTDETGPGAPAHSALVRGISQTSRSADESFILGKAHHQEQNFEIAATKELVEERKVDGVVIWPADRFHTGSPSVDYLRKNDIPFVVVPEPDLKLYGDCHTVSNNDSEGATKVMRHLLECGFRKIAFMSDTPPVEVIFVEHRQSQYRQAMESRGLVPVELEIPGIHHNPKERIAKDLMEKVKKCDAVFCCTDAIAAKLMCECLRLGIRMPGDLAVAGYDNTSLAQAMDLTSVEQHFEKIGEKAVKLLLDEIEGKCTKPKHLNVGSELIIRGSTGK
jgi:LacI family transcriptional regulator